MNSTKDWMKINRIYKTNNFNISNIQTNSSNSNNNIKFLIKINNYQISISNNNNLEIIQCFLLNQANLIQYMED
jgi:hypothetical protein